MSEPNEPGADIPPDYQAPKKKAPLWQRLLPWVITIVCFAYLYNRIASQTPEGETVLSHLGNIFAEVDWVVWLAIMIPYSFLYLLIDTAVLWRVIRWFNANIPYRDLLPVRASTYIISILNEQVGKGAMALYLNRREGVPGWEVGSSMLFIMFCEFFYLLTWALIGVSVSWNIVPEIFHNIPYIFLAALIFLVGFIYFFREDKFGGVAIKRKPLLKSFHVAKWHYYPTIILIRSPALVGAVWVYSMAAGLFGVDIPFIQMIGVLPLILFGTLIPGPFRAFAVALWPTLFPEHVAEMAIFGFVQHNFFLLFNAGIGLIFLKRANKELFSGEVGPATHESRAS